MRHNVATIPLTALLIASILVPTASQAGGNFLPKAYLAPVELRLADPDFLDSYGLAVGASGDDAFIGVPLDNAGFVFTPGTVEVYRRTGSDFTLTQVLSPADGGSGDEFGRGISVSGDVAVIGAPAQNQQRGAAYVFRKIAGVWTFEAKLLPADPQMEAGFGGATAVDGDTLVIGAPGYSQRRGAAYVFTRSGGSWSQQLRLAPSPSAINDDFGVSLQLHGRSLLIGATGADTIVLPANNVGAVFVFEGEGGSWNQTQRWTHPTDTADQAFGLSLSLSGDRAAVGAPFADINGIDSAGAVVTYRRTPEGWLLDTAMSAMTPGASQLFGYSVALRDERLIVGLPRGNVGAGTQQGAAEVFLDEFGTWLPTERLNALTPSINGRFGDSVALADNFALIGAPQNSNFEGAAYVFTNLRSNTTLALPTAPVKLGAAASFISSVSLDEPGGLTGNVQISDDLGATCSITLSGGSGSCSLTPSEVGIREILGRYSGAAGVAESFAAAELQVVPDLSIGPSTLPDGQIGVAYSQQLLSAAAGATTPLNWSLDSGSLPPEVELSSQGVLSGLPDSAGVFGFRVRVTDSSNAGLGGPFSETRDFQLRIQPPFITQLSLTQTKFSGDRGSDFIVSAALDVLDPSAQPPIGTYLVSAVNGAGVIQCSSPVTAEGLLSCALESDAGNAVGNHVLTARFSSNNADYSDAESLGSLVLFSPADAQVVIDSLDPLYTPDEPVRHRIQVSNNGPDEAYALRLQTSQSVALPATSWTCSGAACPAASGVGMPAFTLASLPSGAEIVLEIEALMLEAPPAQFTLGANVELLPNGFSRELTAANDSAESTSLPVLVFAGGFED